MSDFDRVMSRGIAVRNHRMLTLHYMARSARPSNAALATIGAHFKGVRFRVAQHEARLSVGVRTITQPVVETLIHWNGRYRWVVYQFLSAGEEVSEQGGFD